MRKCECGKRLSGVSRTKAYNRRGGTILGTCRNSKGDYVTLGKKGKDYFIQQKKGHGNTTKDYFERLTAKEIFKWNCMNLKD
mgnify:CR=1 FL=1